MDKEIKQKEYCRLTGLTRKALLIYEQKSILIPSRIDPDTGYRFYNENEISRGIKIALLRSLDFTVPEIESIINDSSDTTTLLTKKEQEPHKKRQLFEHGIRFMELNRGDSPFSNDLRETKLSLYQVATMEGRGTVRDLSVHLKLLSRYVRQYGALECGPTGTYFFPDSSDIEIHFKVFVPVTGEWLTTPNGFLIENFGAPRFVFLRHYGTYELIPSTYSELRAQMTEKGETISGEYLEIYRNPPTSLTGTDTTTIITDIGVPQWY